MNQRAKPPADPKVEALLSQPNWNKERKKLRSIILDCQLTEEVKWGKLCYTFGSSNLVVIYGLKEFCAAGFLKGVLLKDKASILAAPGAHSQSARWMKFTSMQEITKMEPVLRAYIAEAIKAEKAGLKVAFKEKDELELPDELLAAFKKKPALRTAFESLTPGRQRGYVLHFSAAKQSKTRVARIEKCTPKILAKKGMNDR